MGASHSCNDGQAARGCVTVGWHRISGGQCAKKYAALADQIAAGAAATRKIEIANIASAKGISWTQETGKFVQTAIDKIRVTDYFSSSGLGKKFGLDFSITIADPLLDDCPLIGCSAGFAKLSGYEMKDVIGRNCTFLTEAVPTRKVNEDSSKHSVAFCKAAKRGEEYRLPDSFQTSDQRPDRPGDELFLMQTHARKDGKTFDSFLFMKVFELGAQLGEGQPYVVTLQTEIAGGLSTYLQITDHVEELDATMEHVKCALSSLFFVQCSMSREPTPTLKSSIVSSNFEPDSPCLDSLVFGQERPERQASDRSEEIRHKQEAPMLLYEAFKPEDVKPWQKGRFRNLGKLNDAPRNKGCVHLARDEVTQELFAIKQMPNSWVKASHVEFLEEHPEETELPWQDIGCTRYLNSVGFKYACDLEGVYRSQDSTFVISTFASEGDLFDVAVAGLDPGPGLEREAALAPLVYQLCSGLKQLHDMNIAHRDISLENVLLTRGPSRRCEVKIIDYSMASTERVFPCRTETVRGKLSYQAPEMHTQENYDAFLSEVFAVGVLIYTLCLKDYPWLSTAPGVCKNFEFVEQHGLKEFCQRRKVRGSDLKVSQCSSDSLLQLLEGMLQFDPERRLTFGEKQLPDRRSVWDEPWMKEYKAKQVSKR
jgi:hypothetical protein